MKSTVGRPRVLTDEQVSIVLAWHDAVVAWRAERAKLKTQRQLARELGVTPGAIASVIRRRGEFKQVSPEHRQNAIQSRRRHVADLRRLVSVMGILGQASSNKRPPSVRGVPADKRSSGERHTAGVWQKGRHESARSIGVLPLGLRASCPRSRAGLVVAIVEGRHG
jgi:hypothetical protein